MPNEEIKIESLEVIDMNIPDRQEDSFSVPIKKDQTTKSNFFVFGNIPIQVLAATNTIRPQGTICNIIATVGGGAVTLTSNPSISPGDNGQILILRGSSTTDTITLTDGNGMILSENMTLGLDDTITLYYDGLVNNKWVEITRNCSCAPMGEISYFNTTGTAVTIAEQSDGSTNMVVCAPVTALNSDSFEFDNGGSNNGRLRYTGRKTKLFHVACTISIASSGDADMFVFGIAKGGTVVAATKILNKITTALDTQSTALHGYISLATNEYIELYVGNTTDGDDLTIKSINLF